MTPTETGTDPVRWWVWDNFLDAPFPEPPPVEWHRWEARYDNDCERGKLTARDLSGTPYSDWLIDLRRNAPQWSRRLGYPVQDDPLLHGGGLHVMRPGGHLACHLDYARHPHLDGKRRAINLLLFVHPRWEREWGGQFFLADPLGKPVRQFDPLPGRLLAFETSDLSYHGVQPVTGPVPRASLAVYFLAQATATDTRQRALFLPTRLPTGSPT